MTLPGAEDGEHVWKMAATFVERVQHHQSLLEQVIVHRILDKVPRYRELPVDDVCRSVHVFLSTLLAIVAGEHYAKGDAILHETYHRRILQRFTLGEFVQALTTSRDILLHLATATLHFADLQVVITRINRVMDHTILLASEMTCDSRERTQRHRLEKSQRHTQQNTLLLHAALDIAGQLNQAYLLQHCLQYARLLHPGPEICVWSELVAEFNWTCRMSSGMSAEPRTLIDVLIQTQVRPEENLLMHLAQQAQGRLEIPNVADHPSTAHFPELRRFSLSLVLIPLARHEEIFGVILLIAPRTFIYSHQALENIEQIAMLSAAALDHARLLVKSRHTVTELKQTIQELQRTADRLERTYQVGEAISGKLDLDDALHAVIEELSRALDLPQVGIFRLEDHQHVFVLAGRGIAPDIQQRFLHRTAEDISPIIAKLREHPHSVVLRSGDIERWISPVLREVIPLKTMIIVPLIFQGEMIGHVVLSDPERDKEISADDLAFLDTVAGQVAATLEAARILSERKEQLHQLELINRLGRELMISLDAREIVQAFHRGIADLLPFIDFTLIWRIEPHNSQEMLVLKSHFGIRHSVVASITALTYTDVFREHFLQHPLSLTAPDADAMTSLPDPMPHLATALQARSLSISPLWSRGAIRGVVILGSRREHPWTQNEQNMLDIISSLLGLALTNARLYHTEVESAQHLQTALQVEQQASQDLRHLNQAKTEFMENVTHELKTPLTTILGYANLLLNHPDDRVREISGHIERGAKRLQQMISDMLDLSRLSVGRMPLRFSSVPIAEIAREVFDSLRLRGEEKGLILSYALPAELPLVWADHSSVERIITNLLDNAIKYTEKGSIVLSARATATDVEFEVTDTGRGIAQEALDKIFTRFYGTREQSSAAIESTGLGLSIVRSLIDAQHGRLWVKSAIGKGSTFGFSLPRADRQQGIMEAEKA